MEIAAALAGLRKCSARFINYETGYSPNLEKWLNVDSGMKEKTAQIEK